MNPERVSEKKHWNDFWNRDRDVSEVYDNENRVSRHLSEIAPIAGMRVLEVGAGTGRDGILMARQGASVVSLDYSPVSLGIIGGQLSGGDDVALCCADAFALPFADGTFDLVFHQGLLEHFRNPREMLAEHRRVLRDGGLILVDVPQRWHYYTPVKRLLISTGRWFAGWETEFSPRELESLVGGCGFEIVKTYGEWLNPPIWYRMLRKSLIGAGIRLPMRPRLFALTRRAFAPLRERALRSRMMIYTAVVIGTIARKK